MIRQSRHRGNRSHSPYRWCIAAWSFCGALLLSSATLAAAQEVLRGRVVDAQTGEPIGRALVALPALGRDVTTDDVGRFEIEGLTGGRHELAVTTVGYGLLKRTVDVTGGVTEVELRLGQEALRRAEDVTVEVAPFEPADKAAPLEMTLGGVELRNLASVLADDPLRSVQSLPGVAASDDFGASFAVRGSGFSSVGFYIDGVLLNAPFHTIRDVNDGFSLTILNGDVVDSLSFVAGGAPARYGDRTGAVLNARIRDGSRDRFFGRASLGATGLYGTLEGPVGTKTSWLVSARKSYLDYVLDRIDADSGTRLGYHDVTGKLTHHPAAADTLSLLVLHGRSRWRNEEDERDPREFDLGEAGTGLAILQWRHAPGRWWSNTTAFAARETGRNRDFAGVERLRSQSGQRGARVDAGRVFGRHQVEVGGLFRDLDEDAVARDYDGARRVYRASVDYDAGSVQWGGYLQDTWTSPGGRASLTAGARFDRLGATGEFRLLPRASATLALSPTTRLAAGYGRYAQFPRLDQLYGELAGASLRAEGSQHFGLALERSLGSHVRARVEAYEQRESDLIFAGESEWRLEGGRIAPPAPSARLANALSGRSRGLEILLQRRSANGVSGWLAYSFGRATRSSRESSQRFDSDFDQRHAVTAFASWRAGRTLNLSAKYRYGSGFPVPGFYQERDGGVFLAAERNLFRPDTYSRLDLRANKTWLLGGHKLTLYTEVVNVFDRTHRRYADLDALNARTGQVAIENETLLPLLPSIGITIDF